MASPSLSSSLDSRILEFASMTSSNVATNSNYRRTRTSKLNASQLDSQTLQWNWIGHRVWLVSALTCAYTSTLVVGAGVRRSVSISLWSRGYLSADLHAMIPWICSHFKDQPHRNHRSRKQPTRNLKNDLQLKVAGPVDMSLSLLSTSYLVLNIALNIITAFKTRENYKAFDSV